MIQKEELNRNEETYKIGRRSLFFAGVMSESIHRKHRILQLGHDAQYAPTPKMKRRLGLRNGMEG